ncbi:hypothetical protein [Moraxella canis]|uniref:Uncharacterized protein n=1 Tax=Moraxella canis TaxID=90239 RepID=A0A1S9ZKL0_9GAMM|nr:hypothetical protein [Moraxella canis]OOR83893.1 hypothetical protein B0180_05480 [Moraxella canis]
MLIRQTPLAKRPGILTNEQVEAWMNANPDRVQRLDNTAYDHSISVGIRSKPEKRKQVKRLDSKAIKDALAKQQRQVRKKLPISATKPKKMVRRPMNRLEALAKRRDDWLQYLQTTGCPMTSREAREMFGITNPKFTAERINQDGEYISITKEMYKNRKTLIFRAINYER